MTPNATVEARAASWQTYGDALADYADPHSSFLAHVRAALAKVPAAAQSLRDAKAERTATAAGLGTTGAPLADPFRDDGLSANISALKSAVVTLTFQVAALYSQVVALGQFFAQNGGDPIRQQELIAFQTHYANLLLECVQSYAVNLLLL